MAFGTNTTLTLNGRILSASQMAGLSSTPPKFLATGNNATGAARTAAVGDVALSSEQLMGNASRIGTNAATNTANVFSVVQTVQNLTAVPYSIDEAGLFTAASAGIMAVSATFGVVTLNANDSLQATSTITYS